MKPLPSKIFLPDFAPLCVCVRSTTCEHALMKLTQGLGMNYCMVGCAHGATLLPCNISQPLGSPSNQTSSGTTQQKNGHRQGMPPCRLQNEMKSQPTFNPNTKKHIACVLPCNKNIHFYHKILLLNSYFFLFILQLHPKSSKGHMSCESELYERTHTLIPC